MYSFYEIFSDRGDLQFYYGRDVDFLDGGGVDF